MGLSTVCGSRCLVDSADTLALGHCRYEMSVTAGTIFPGQSCTSDDLVSRHVADHQPEERHERLGSTAGTRPGSYKTAWAMLHKLRRPWFAQARPAGWRCRGGRGLLGRRGNRRNRQRGGGKGSIIVAAEEDGKGIGRIRLRTIPDASSVSLHGFIQEAIAPGSTVRTDGWKAYLDSRIRS